VISTIQIVLASLMVLAGSFVMVMNWAVIVQWMINGKHSSWVPFVGGSLVAMGMVIAPFAFLNKFWWIPFFADWGCVPGIGMTAFYFVWKRSKSDERIKD